MTDVAARRVTVSGIGLAGLLAVSHATNDAFSSFLPVLLPYLQARFSFTETALAGLVAVTSISSNVLQAFAGALADRWGRRKSAALALILGSVLMSTLPIVPTPWALVVVLVIGGLGSALFHPAAASMARQAGNKAGLAVGAFGSGGPLGAAVMPIVALWLLRSRGPEAIPWLALIGVALGLALWWLAPDEPSVRGDPRKPPPRIFDVDLFRGPVGALALVGILRAMAYISFVNAVPLYLVQVRGYAPDAELLGYTLAAYSAAAAIGMFAAGALEMRFGRQRIVVTAMLLAFPLMLATLVLPPGSWAFYLAVVLGGIGVNAPIPVLVVAAQDLAPHAVATASGMLMGFTWGVAGVAYVGFGVLQQAIGLVPALAVGFSFLLPAAWLTVRVLQRYPHAAGSAPHGGRTA